MTKIFHLYDRFFVSNRNFTTKHAKNVQNSRFFFKISQTRGFLCLNCQIPGKVATLYLYGSEVKSFKMYARFQLKFQKIIYWKIHKL